MTNCSDPDMVLFKRMVAGDKLAADQFARKYGRMILGYCCRWLYDRQEAENAAQEALMKYFKSMHNIREPKKFKSFLYRIARNCCIDIIRARRNETELDDNTDSASEQSLDDVITSKERIALVRKILEEFDPVQKDAILLVHYQGLTYKEAAEALDIPEGTVKTKVSRGLIKLANLLNKRGIFK